MPDFLDLSRCAFGITLFRETAERSVPGARALPGNAVNPHRKCERSGLATILFALQRKCGIGVPPMEKTNMAGTAMPLKWTVLGLAIYPENGFLRVFVLSV